MPPTDVTTPTTTSVTTPVITLASTPGHPSRSIVLDGASNFRDLGGYVGEGGRSVLWRKLFRSDHLGLLSAGDQTRLGQLALQRVADFRGVTERLAQPCALPGAAVHALSIEPSLVQALEGHHQRGDVLTAAIAQELMRATYRDFVRCDTPRFADLFALLLQGDAPLVFHCTAGKDRTGFAAALILHSLGVAPSAVMQDYLLTNQLYRPPQAVGGDAPAEVRDAIRRVQPDYLQAALEVVDNDHGGMARYLEDGLGLDAKKRSILAKLYLSS